MAVTEIPGMNQCAEMESIARGRGRLAAMADHALVYAFDSKAFIGLPCPKKIAGMRSLMTEASSS